MWYTVLLSLVVDVGGLVLVYVLLRDRVRRAVAAQTRIGEIREEVSRLLVELNQATDRNIAVMEDRIAVLNEAIATADKKIGLLRRETEKHDVGSQIYSRLAEGRPMRAPSASEGPAGERAPAPPLRAPPTPAAAAAPLSVELTERSAGAPSGEPAPDMRQRVMMLFRSGFSPSLIASRVGAPRGEVELIISLEQRKGQA